MPDKPVKEIGFDESFKILAKHFFGKFSKVITDFEIIKLPKKADVLVIETEKPIAPYVRIFNYFKRFNIIEFKSVSDPFRMTEDLPKILIYTGGLLLNEKQATIANTTFTIFSSRKPEGFLRAYKKHVQIIQNGVYLIDKIVQVPVYIVCANEVKGNFDGELAFVKEFSTGNERIQFIEEVLNGVLNGKQGFSEYLHFAFSLYRSEINTILSKKGVSMTIVEKNIRAWNEQLGLKDAYEKEGDKKRQLSVARKMLKKGFSLQDIMDTTELSRQAILKLREKK